MTIRTLLTLGVIIATTASTLRADDVIRAAWPGVYPELNGYGCRYQAPALGKDPTKVFRQTALYEWTGGDIRSLTVTIGRGPDFAADAVRKGERIEVGKRAAWVKDGMLTIPLGEDRAIQLKGGGSDVGKQAAMTFASQFPLERIAKALDNPPRTNFFLALEPFKAITKDMTFRDLTEFVGSAEKDIGSGIHIMTYPLPGGGRVLVGTPDFVKIVYIVYETKEGKKTDILR